jgi:hypothetical protein
MSADQPGGRLPLLAKKLVEIEFESSTDIAKYASVSKEFGKELYALFSFDAAVIEAALSSYRGKWFLFGADRRRRAKKVAGHLAVGAEAAKIFGTAAINMNGAFQRLFVRPEKEAQAKAKHRKARGFRIEGVD